MAKLIDLDGLREFKSKLETEFSSAMVFKGTLGSTGATTDTLPEASASTAGYTYKVITQGTYQSISAQVGDVFTCATGGTSTNPTYSWVLIPSGDEPSGTVTSIALNATTPIKIDNTDPITSSGTRTISHATSGATAGSYGDSAAQTPAYSGTFKVPYITIDTYGHVTGISDHTVKIPAAYSLPTASASTLGGVKVGTNLSISNGVLSATNTTYTAGTNVSISTSNEISATDTTYTAGTNVSISSSNVISATDTTYTFADGTNSFTVTPSGGTAQTVKVTPSISNNALTITTISGTVTISDSATSNTLTGTVGAPALTLMVASTSEIDALFS